LVQTVDYITPVVDDPYTFGAIAAANALSDIYAMGARPILALNLVGYPVKTLPMSLLGEILRGGADKLAEAGASLVGGHSIDDHEPKYGLAVTGLVHPDRIVTKAGARRGDLLVLTKPLGIGIITTGIDRRLVDEETAQRAVDVMLHLNRDAADAMAQAGVHACTDVTGFGLLGHLREMLVASKVSARVDLRQVPVLEEAWDLANRDCIPDGSYNNHRYLAEFVRYDPTITRAQQLVLCDAQTSGGLLMAVPPDRVEGLLATLEAAKTPVVAVIGEIVEEPEGRISVISNQ
jgi:selenide,water dikinase